MTGDKLKQVLERRIGGWQGNHKQLLASILEAARGAEQIGDLSLAEALRILVSTRTLPGTTEELGALYNKAPNPYPYRVYVVQRRAVGDGTTDREVVHAEFIGGNSLPDEARRRRDDQIRSMNHQDPVVPDSKGIFWSVEIRYELYPEWPDQ